MKDKTTTPADDKTPASSAKDGGSKEAKTLTQAQVDQLIIKTKNEVREKAEAEKQEAIKKAIEEADKLAKLTAEERESELKKKYEEGMREREKTIALKENKYEVVDKFAQEKVPIELADLVVREGKDETLKEAESLINIFKSSVANAVTEQLKGRPPKDLDSNSDNSGDVKVKTSF